MVVEEETCRSSDCAGKIVSKDMLLQHGTGCRNNLLLLINITASTVDPTVSATQVISTKYTPAHFYPGWKGSLHHNQMAVMSIMK